MPLTLEQRIEALRSLRGSDRDPDGRAFAPLADAYREAGRLREAMVVLREGIERHPDFTTAHVVAARLYAEAGLTAESEVSARRVLQLDAENTIALGVLADALDARGESAEAEDVRRRLQEVLAPSDWSPEAAPAGEAPVDVGALAADEEDEAVLDIGALAADEEDEAVLDIGALAADEEDEAVLDIGALTADEEDEAVLDVGALAADGDEDRALDPEAGGGPWPSEPMVVPAEPTADETDGRELAALFGGGGDVADDILPSDELEDELPVVTRTLAELFVAQGLRDRAIEVYRQLVRASPDDPTFAGRLAELEGLAAEAVHEPPEGPPEVLDAPDEDDLAGHAWHAHEHTEGHDVDTPFAWTDDDGEEGPVGPPISDYFGRLLSWESSGSSAEGVGDGGTPRPHRTDA